jgi:hypothetical protein
LPAVFADPMADTLHLSHPWFFGIFSGALLLSGLLGPLAGRMIDRHGGRDVGDHQSYLRGWPRAALIRFRHLQSCRGLDRARIGMGFGLTKRPSPR